MKRPPRWAVALALAAASAASGCLLGPDYARPPVEVPASYGEAQAASAAQASLDTEWWKLDRRRDEPAVAERVAQGGGAVAVRLVLRRPLDASARGGGALHECVDVLHQ